MEALEIYNYLINRLNQRDVFKYFGSYLTDKGNLYREISHRIEGGLMNWKKLQTCCVTGKLLGR